MSERKYFAAGDYVTRFSAGSPQEIIIDSPREKPNWKERSPGGAVSSVFPGTAILFEERYYELIRIVKQPGEKPRYLYT